jgi:hypothetical protein
MDLYYGIVLSLHLGLPGEYNFVHPYVGVNYKDFIAGAYYNSNYDLSLYAGYNFDMAENISFELGVASGYDYGHLVPMIKLNYESIFIAPSVDENVLGLVTGIDWRF